ncbi:MAG: VOC family protein [Christensenellales bacterium]|jgi:predicted enzyme related to lactoylglutathione lyase
MDNVLKIKMYSFTLDCKQPIKLANFYSALLNWEVGFYDDDYAWVYPPGTHQGAYPCILFQLNPEYEPPVWPEKPDAQQQMAHIDFAVDDLEKAVDHAIRCGAKTASEQFSENWTVMLDPAGHPFCLCQMKSVIESAHFALL